MKKIILIMLIIYCGHHIVSSDETTKETEEIIETEINEDENSTTHETTEQNISKQPALKKNILNDHKNCIRSEKKLFINGQDNLISIIVTDKYNKQHYYTIPAGTKKIVDHVPLHIKKITYKGNYEHKDMMITGATLQTYAVFVFTLDHKVDKFHFIDINQKIKALNLAQKALRQARLTINIDKKIIEKLTKKVEEIQEHTLYLL